MDVFTSNLNRLDRESKHWALRVLNNKENGRRYECCVWAYGRRFTVSRKSPEDAVCGALEYMDGMTKKSAALKLAQ
jgi:hypothetical protein